MENVQIDYYTASWCGPCRSMAPAIAELQAAGWNINKIDADANPAEVRANGIMGIPAFIIKKDGNVVSRVVGARNKIALETEFRIARDS